MITYKEMVETVKLAYDDLRCKYITNTPDNKMLVKFYRCIFNPLDKTEIKYTLELFLKKGKIDEVDEDIFSKCKKAERLLAIAMEGLTEIYEWGNENNFNATDIAETTLKKLKELKDD